MVGHGSSPTECPSVPVDGPEGGGTDTDRRPQIKEVVAVGDH